MNLRRISTPFGLPVSLQEAKDHTSVAHPDDDHLIETYIAAATERLDGANGYLGRALITQIWELALDGFPNEVCLPLPPCQDIDGITYITPAGLTEELYQPAFTITGLGSTNGTTILFHGAKPATARRPTR